MALVITMGNFGGAIASNIFRTQDVPRYILGCVSINSYLHDYNLICHTVGIEIMFIVMGMLVIPIVALAYMRLNARKDELERHVEETSGRSCSEMFNEEKFRYTL